jgi:hypothetical protein
MIKFFEGGWIPLVTASVLYFLMTCWAEGYADMRAALQRDTFPIPGFIAKLHGKGRVKGIECIKMTLGEPDKSGRRRPIPVEGTEFTLDVDTVVVAVGNSSNPLIPNTTPDIKVNEWGNIVINSETGETSKRGCLPAAISRAAEQRLSLQWAMERVSLAGG